MVFTSKVSRAIYLRRSLPASHGSSAHICGKVGYVSVLGGGLSSFLGKKAHFQMLTNLGRSLGMRVKVTGCECLACL